MQKVSTRTKHNYFILMETVFDKISAVNQLKTDKNHMNTINT